MLESLVIRYGAIIAGTVLWDLGAIVQKSAVRRLPPGRLPVMSLLGSPAWMLGLLLTALGWGMFVFGLDRVPISAARTVTAGSYVILAAFSWLFLRTPLSPVEWAAVALVTAGIVLLGLHESEGQAALSAGRVLVGVACMAALSALVFLAPRFLRQASRAAMISFFAFTALSGLLGSVGDLLTKVFLDLVAIAPRGAVPLAAAGMGLIAFYLAGFYMLSRAYQVGSVVGGVVVSDFFGRVGALFLGWLSLSESIGGQGPGGLERGLGFLLVLGGSLLLGRFSASPGTNAEH